jgi:uncharacterized protein (DUF1015 family)
MATIKAFRGIRPNTSSVDPLAFLSGTTESGLELDYIKMRLEPHKDGTGPSHSDCIEFLHSLLANDNYIQEEQNCLYVYECIIGSRSHTGVYALTSLADLERGEILTHEHTLETLENQISLYRKEVGLEGAAILLTHEPCAEIKGLIRNVQLSRDGFSYAKGETYHKFWKVNSAEEIQKFKDAFSKLGKVYLADGHHRLGSAEKLNKVSPQWISSLYLATTELEIEPFHRLLLLDQLVNNEKKMERLEEYFFISPIPNNKPYRPSHKNRFGMFANEIWFQLDLRPELKMENPIDAEFLQQKVLSGIFGIDSPKTDPQLKCFADSDWKKLLLEMAKEPDAIVFTLFGISTEDFLRLSLVGKTLPPKSTSIGPKPPYGMLMFCDKLIARKGVQP